MARQNTAPRSRQEFGRGDARLDGWNSAPRRQVDNRAGDLSKLGMVRNSSSTGLGPQLSQFNSTRSSSRRGNAAGNILTRDGSGQSSRGTTGAATPLSVTSTNSFEYVFLLNKLMIVYSGTSQRRRTIILPRESRVSSLLMTKFPTVATTPSLPSSLFHPLHQSLISLSSGTITGKSLSKTRSI